MEQKKTMDNVLPKMAMLEQRVSLVEKKPAAEEKPNKKLED